jgi:hypothetical protein
MASLHKATEDDPATETEAPKTAPGLEEPNSSEEIALPEVQDLIKSRLSVIQDEKENLQKDSVESLPAITVGSDDSPASTLRRFATTKIKSSWAPDGQRIITPPLRTSSANSLNQSRATSLSMAADVPTEEKENVPRATATRKASTHGKRSRGMGKNGAMAEGIRSFFR